MRVCILKAAFGFALLGSALGCDAGGNQDLIDDKRREDEAILAVKQLVQGDLDALHAAAVAIRNAAPEPDSDGWSAASDAAAVSAMRLHWKEARRAYERIEGAIAVVFPDLDAATDDRYDRFIEELPDNDLFDDLGVTGIHGIERILWADSIPAAVVAFESGLPNYVPAAFPATAEEAGKFKTKLCERLVVDTKAMSDRFGPLALDAASAYRGVIGSMMEQVEKVNKAATGEEESRYASHTLADMRANVEGGIATYDVFRSWLLAKGGDAVDAEIQGGFDRIVASYDATPGDGLPQVPEGWSSESPSAEHLATPFGTLFMLLSEETDPEHGGSLVHSMSESAERLGIRHLP